MSSPWPHIFSRDMSVGDRFIDITECGRGLEVLQKAGIIESAPADALDRLRGLERVSGPRGTLHGSGEYYYGEAFGKQNYVLCPGYSHFDVNQAINQVREHERHTHIRTRESAVADAISMLD